ncbi:MAG: hypothetical protein WBV90_20805, partial [Terrimicrobiaceae bacterium]
RSGRFQRAQILGQAPLAHRRSPNEDGCERNHPDAHQTERARFRNDLEDIAAFGCEVKFSIRILAK